MKREQVSVWAVQVRRDAYCTVLVRHHDPVEVRRIALENTDGAVWTVDTQAIAYPLEGRPTQAVWTTDGWQYPETPMTFKEDK